MQHARVGVLLSVIKPVNSVRAVPVSATGYKLMYVTF